MIFIKIIKIILFIFFSNIVYSEKVDIDKIFEDKANHIRAYLVENSLKFEHIKHKLREDIVYKDYNNSGELFLDNIESDGAEMSFGIDNSNIYSKDYNRNTTQIGFNKLIFLSGNVINTGLYLSYTNLYYKLLLNNINVGVDLSAKLTDYNIKLKIVNEYNRDIGGKDYNTNTLLGGISLSYKQKIGKFYIEPLLHFSYKYGFKNSFKFSNTSVTVKPEFLYNVGGNIRSGINFKNNDNKYNIYFDFGIDKRLKSKEYMTIHFRDKDRESVGELYRDIVYDINFGSNILLNNLHKINFNIGGDFSENIKSLKFNLGYYYIKN